MNLENTPANQTDETDKRSPVPGRYPLRVKGLFGLFMIIVADLLFFDVPIGWTAGLYTLLLTGGMLVATGRYPDDWTGGLALCWLVLMAGSLAVRLSFVTYLLTIVALGMVYVCCYQTHFKNVFTMLRYLFVDFAALWITPIRDALSLRNVSRRSDSNTSEKRIRWGPDWVLPGCLFVLFLGLFTLANPILSSWGETLWYNLTDVLSELFAPGRMGFWLITGVVVWGLIRHRYNNQSNPAKPSDKTGSFMEFVRMSPVAITRSLLVFNVMFLIQNGLDVTYLWGGRTLPEGLTYAEYAHRGSYPLVVTALLAALFVLLAFRTDESTETMKTAHWLVYVWLVQNIFLLVSAAWRLWIYVDFYGLTRWRVSTTLWMILVAGGLALILVRIAGGWSNTWLVNANAMMTILLLSACSFVNVDRHIASYNVQHSQEVNGAGARLDVGYLTSLGPDALPALHRVLPHLKQLERRETVRQSIVRHEETLRKRTRDWRGYTVRRMRLLHELRRTSP